MKTDLTKRRLIGDLRKTKINAYKRIADELEKPTRRMPSVGLYKIGLYVKDNETAVIPGKVIATGEFNKKITVSAFKFSESALEKINKTGKAITIQELIKKNPKAQGVRILK